METLDLCRNSLPGTLPPEIGNMGRLKMLNLSSNRLSGQLPSELSKLSYLSYLDLSWNNFKGNIPESDKLSSSLQVFNVSYNDVSGSVPENLGALGYRAPELASAAKPIPSFKTYIYAFGVILMELLTRRSVGDITSGQSGAVDLTNGVWLCDQEGRGMDCIDRHCWLYLSKAMDKLLVISPRCILPVNERPNIRQVFEDMCSIAA